MKLYFMKNKRETSANPMANRTGQEKNTAKVLRRCFVSIALLLGFTACESENVEDVISDALSLDKTIEVNVSVATDNQSLTSFVVQTMAGMDTVTADSSTVRIKVFDNGKPQIIAITDEDDNLLMMYRAPVTDGQNIVIDAESTTLALATFSPLFGPVKSDEYDEMIAIITSMSSYPDFQNAVARAMSHGYDLTDTTNGEVVAKLYNLFRELCEIAYRNQSVQQTKTKDVDDFINCWPIIANTSGNTLTLRASGTMPSYYGELLNGDDGSKIQDICVPSRAAYGFMDMFTHTASNMHLGEPVDIVFENDGTYLFHLSRTNAAATSDFYMHLVSNILGVLGADLSNQQITMLSSIVGRAIDAQQLQFDNMQPGAVMDIINFVYGETVNFLADEYRNVGCFANWRLAGVALKKLTTIYNLVKNATDAMLRITWAMSDIREEIDFCVNYSDNEIQSCQNVSISIVSGNNQIGPAYCVLHEPLRVAVRTRNNEGEYIQMPQKVKFTVVHGNGGVTDLLITTNSNGGAQTWWALGSGHSGVVQSVEAVVIDNEGNEISNTVTFNAMVSNTRWQITELCDWAEADNYASKFDVDFALSNSATGLVDLVPQLMVQGYDYDGKVLFFNLRGTYNTESHGLVMDIDVYTDHINNGGYRCRTDRFTTILEGYEIMNLPGTLTYDNGAGCPTKINMYLWTTGYAPKSPANEHRVPEGIPEEYRTVKRTINQQ